MIDNVMTNIGAIFLIAGGVLVFAAVLGFCGYIVAILWTEARNKWRSICKAESLILEYKKNRYKFLAWKKEQEEHHG